MNSWLLCLLLTAWPSYLLAYSYGAVASNNERTCPNAFWNPSNPAPGEDRYSSAWYTPSDTSNCLGGNGYRFGVGGPAVGDPGYYLGTPPEYPSLHIYVFDYFISFQGANYTGANLDWSIIEGPDWPRMDTIVKMRMGISIYVSDDGGFPYPTGRAAYPPCEYSSFQYWNYLQMTGYVACLNVSAADPNQSQVTFAMFDHIYRTCNSTQYAATECVNNTLVLNPAVDDDDAPAYACTFIGDATSHWRSFCPWDDDYPLLRRWIYAKLSGNAQLYCFTDNTTSTYCPYMLADFKQGFDRPVFMVNIAYTPDTLAKKRHTAEHEWAKIVKETVKQKAPKKSTPWWSLFLD